MVNTIRCVERLQKTLAESGEDGDVSVQHRSYGSDNGDSALPNFRLVGAEVPFEHAVVDLSELSENFGPLLAVHGQNGGEVLKEPASHSFFPSVVRMLY